MRTTGRSSDTVRGEESTFIRISAVECGKKERSVILISLGAHLGCLLPSQLDVPSNTIQTCAQNDGLRRR